MSKNIIKRDGTIVAFDPKKIRAAISAAFISARDIAIPPKEFNDILNEWIEGISDNTSVEEIQDSIEVLLMDYKFFDVAKAYMLYRAQHKDTRFIQERLDYMQYYQSSIDNASTSSETDDNANVTTKNVSNLEAEVYKANNRNVQRLRMRNKLNSLYPNEGLGKQYINDLEHYIIYTHDEASTPVIKNYCEAVSMYPLVLDGTSTMDGLKTKAPKNLNSFCGQMINLTFLLASQCKGAVAFGEFFNFFDYYCVKEWGCNYDMKVDLNATSTHCKIKRTIGDMIDQAFQHIVYNWNQPSGNRGYQSPLKKTN